MTIAPPPPPPPPRSDPTAPLLRKPVGRVAAPLHEQVLGILRRAILTFELRPGQRLVERELIEQIGVSRTTIREVLRELTTEGLVTVIPQRGAVVAELSPADAADLYEARAVLEALVVHRFIERASAEQMTAYQRAVEGFAAVAVDGADVLDMLAAKDHMYDALLDGAGSPVLQQLLGGIQARVRALRAASLSAPGRPQQACTEILAMAAAIADRDTDAAARLSDVHLRNAATSGAGLLGDDPKGPALLSSVPPPAGEQAPPSAGSRRRRVTA